MIFIIVDLPWLVVREGGGGGKESGGGNASWTGGGKTESWTDKYILSGSKPLRLLPGRGDDLQEAFVEEPSKLKLAIKKNSINY